MAASTHADELEEALGQLTATFIPLTASCANVFLHCNVFPDCGCVVVSGTLANPAHALIHASFDVYAAMLAVHAAVTSLQNLVQGLLGVVSAEAADALLAAGELTGNRRRSTQPPHCR